MAPNLKEGFSNTLRDEQTSFWVEDRPPGCEVAVCSPFDIAVIIWQTAHLYELRRSGWAEEIVIVPDRTEPASQWR